MDISIIICTRNRADSLRQTLESIRGVEIPQGMQVEFLLVDNGSTDHTRQVVEGFQFPGVEVRYIHEPEKGLSRARNRALQESKGDILLWTDDDVRVPVDWVVHHYGPYSLEEVAAVQGAVTLRFEGSAPDWLDKVQRGFLAETFWGDESIYPLEADLVGANMSFRKNITSAIGVFDEILGAGRAGFWDDTQFSRRLRAKSYKQFYQPKARVEHVISAQRLNHAYFRDVAFRNGISAYMAEQEAPKETKAAILYQIVWLYLRKYKHQALRLVSGRPKPSAEQELFHLMRYGYLVASWKGYEKLKSRYSG